MSSAQLDILPPDEAPSQMEAATPFALKEQVAERLAAHRARRTRSLRQRSHTHSSSDVRQIPLRPNRRRRRRALRPVPELPRLPRRRSRASHPPGRSRRRGRSPQRTRRRRGPEPTPLRTRPTRRRSPHSCPDPRPGAYPTPETTPTASAVTITEAPAQIAARPLTVRLYEDAAHPLVSESFAAVHPLHKPEPLDEAEDLALDEEIAFRQSPVFEPTTPPIDIPANLIEFPRQLVAPRKARPRLAEGPLREEATHTHDPAQLRIFEVEPAQISSAPAVESAAPEWSSIMLGALPAAAPVETPEAPFNPVLPLMTAPLRLRLMAAIVDVCIVTAGLLAFITAFALTAGKLLERFPAANASGHMPPQLAAIAIFATFAFLYLLYQVLFFTFAEATPGMRFARIGLCTFSDENPTRAAMRRRLFTCLLSACPFGIGFLWAFLDDDRLGWHDRISRMYQRSY